MLSIGFEKLWIDDDEMLQVAVSASNDLMKATQDFYIYPEDLSKFAKELEVYFPSDPTDEVILEYSHESENFYAFFKLRVFRDSINKMCIEVITDNKRETPELSRAHFFINAELEHINKLGKKLMNWLSANEDKFEYVWKFV